MTHAVHPQAHETYSWKKSPANALFTTALVTFDQTTLPRCYMQLFSLFLKPNPECFFYIQLRSEEKVGISEIVEKWSNMWSVSDLLEYVHNNNYVKFNHIASEGRPFLVYIKSRALSG